MAFPTTDLSELQMYLLYEISPMFRFPKFEIVGNVNYDILGTALYFADSKHFSC
jgi:hypothetical protein